MVSLVIRWYRPIAKRRPESQRHSDGGRGARHPLTDQRGAKLFATQAIPTVPGLLSRSHYTSLLEQHQILIAEMLNKFLGCNSFDLRELFPRPAKPSLNVGQLRSTVDDVSSLRYIRHQSSELHQPQAEPKPATKGRRVQYEQRRYEQNVDSGRGSGHTGVS